MSEHFILDENHNHIQVPLIKWAQWFENADRHVGNDRLKEVNEVHVSTVFLGIDHSFGGDKPLLYETMIFGGKLDQQMERYSTWAEAEEGHKKWLEKAKTALEEKQK